MKSAIEFTDSIMIPQNHFQGVGPGAGHWKGWDHGSTGSEERVVSKHLLSVPRGLNVTLLPPASHITLKVFK